MARQTSSKRKLIQQACAIPYRWRTENGELDENGRELEFCLITSLAKKRWIFPKGIIDPGETREEAALKEAWEEAGLKGTIAEGPLGEFSDQKWGCDLVVQVVVMAVTETAESWPESLERKRQWVPAERALELLNRNELRDQLRRAVDRLTS